MRHLRILTLSLAVCAAVTLPPDQAAAANMIIEGEGTTNRPMQLDVVGTAWVFGSVTWFGGAVWFGIPVVPQGFIPNVNDSFVVEFGFFANFFIVNTPFQDYSYFGVVPAGGVRWDFFLTPQWSVFATGKIGVRWPVFGDSLAETSFAGMGTVGAYWHMSDEMYIRLETGNFGIAQVGISIPF